MGKVMKESSVLNYDAAMEVKRMYEVKDERGRRVHSHRSLAKRFQCSETTILRAINNDGAFEALPTPLGDAEMNKRAAESLVKFQKMVAEGALDKPAAETTKPEEAADPALAPTAEAPYGYSRDKITGMLLKRYF